VVKLYNFYSMFFELAKRILTGVKLMYNETYFQSLDSLNCCSKTWVGADVGGMYLGIGADVAECIYGASLNQ